MTKLSTWAVSRDDVDVRPPRMLRLRVWWASTRLDAELAAGAPPGLSPELAERARQLRRPRHRRTLAKGLEHAIRAAEADRRVTTAATPVDRRQVLRASHELLDVAARLQGQGQVSPEGVAQVSRLLTDSLSVLYRPDPRLPLWRHVRDIAHYLDDCTR